MRPEIKPQRLIAAGALVALIAPTTAAAGNGGFAPLDPQSSNADGIVTSYWLVSVVCIVIFVLVEALLVAFVIRYRRRKRPRTVDGAQIHGSTRLELAWTVFPVLILFVVATFVLVTLPGIKDVPAASAGSQNLVVEVSGSQFAWQYTYPNGVVAVDRLRAPQGRTVELRITAPDWDVIHSWWVPQLGGKQDAIPGQVNTTWFRAKRTGVFLGQCAELCGLYHAKMTAAVEVMDGAAFDSWLEERAAQQASGTSPLGEEEFTGWCAKCHGDNGEGGFGPRLAGTDLVKNPDTIRNVVLNGLGRMPPVGRDWNDTQIDALTAYLEDRFGG